MPQRQTALLAYSLAFIGAAALLAPACRRVDHAQTAAQFRADAERGDPEAQYRLASAYYYGRGVPRDYAEAFRWYQKAADQGSAIAQYAVGYCYQYGRGVPRKPAEAALWERKAADQGYAIAQCQLASLYYSGDGIPQNLAESDRWYRRCADQGSVSGQRNVGLAYARGDAGPRDLAEAARWFRKAAAQGDRLSQLYLAYAYRKGSGVPRDRVQAAGWYLKYAGSQVRRLGWTSVAVLVVCVVTLVVPEQRWGRRRWLLWAILSIACSAYVIHRVGAGLWTGWWNKVETATFVTLAAVTACAAVYEVLQYRRAGGPPAAPAGNTR